MRGAGKLFAKCRKMVTGFVKARLLNMKE